MQLSTKFTALLTAACILSGCATMKHGTHQMVTVNTGSVRGANCTLVNSKGTWAAKNTPNHVQIKRASNPLNVTCSKAGYRTATLLVKSKMSPMLVGDIALPGGSAAAVVDIADGAAFNYPDVITVQLN